MGIFLRTFAAVAAADAIDRAARNQPARYWYPKHPDLPRPGTSIPYVELAPPAPAPGPAAAAAGGRVAWDPRQPERPR